MKDNKIKQLIDMINQHKEVIPKPKDRVGYESVELFDGVLSELLEDYIERWGFFSKKHNVSTPIDLLGDIHSAECRYRYELSSVNLEMENQLFSKNDFTDLPVFGETKIDYYAVFSFLRFRMAHLATINYLTKDKILKDKLRRALYIVRSSNSFIYDLDKNDFHSIHGITARDTIADLKRMSNAVKELRKSSLRENILNSILN
jgi:hypothetical protein